MIQMQQTTLNVACYEKPKAAASLYKLRERVWKEIELRQIHIVDFSDPASLLMHITKTAAAIDYWM